MRLLPRLPFFKRTPPSLHPDLTNLSKFHPQAHKYFGRHLVTPGKEKVVGSWLLFTSGCVFFMVGLGGYTRLTKSGLSMTYWKPLSVAYPQNAEEWQVEFNAYKEFPEFQQNQEIDVERFKSIFFYEYFHRLVGRGLGVVFGLPLAYFWGRGYLLAPLKRRCGALFLLGGLQGAIVYNTWPSMNGFFFSQREYMKIQSWRNFFENTFAVQFNHRMLAYLTYGFGSYLFYLSRNMALLPVQQRAATLLFILLNAQLSLGIYTLIHQCPPECGALTVLSSALLLVHTCRRPSRGFRQYIKHFT